MDTTKKVALVTGGTAGIGEAVVRSMAKLDVQVVFVGRDEDKGYGVERELRDQGADVSFLKADLGVAQEARRIVPFTVEKYGGLNYALNNAGISDGYSMITEKAEEEFDSIFRVNVKGVFLSLQQELRQILKQGTGGSIVNVASSTCVLTPPGRSAYVASKHAIVGLTRSAAIEYGPHGIRVNAVIPGHVRTNMLQEMIGGDRALADVAKSHPLHRIGNPEEIADAVAWLFSDSSSYFTGQSLVLDGGFTVQRPSIFPHHESESEELSPSANVVG